MVGPSFSSISQNDKEANHLAPPTDTHIRGTVLSTCRSRFGSSQFIFVVATSLIMISAAALSWSIFISHDDNSTQQSHDENNGLLPPTSPQPIDWDVIEKQTWGHVDTNRPSQKFRSEFVSGVTYELKTFLEIQQVSVINNREISSHSYMDVENSMSVSGTQFDITLNHVTMTQESMGIEVKYDSKESDNNKSNFLTDLDDLVGKNEIINTDDNYQIIRTSSDPGSQETEQKSITPSSQFELVSRMINVLPEESVEPGDEWNIQIDLGGGIEMIDGQAKLLGYIQYDGTDCALIMLNGTVALDVSTVTDGKMSSVMYWDHQENIARFTEIDLSMSVHIQNPHDASSDSSDSKGFINVPTSEYMQIYLERRE